MNKREAKKIICEWLLVQLDRSITGEFIVSESGDNAKDRERLFAAAEDLQQELMRRAERQQVRPFNR